MSSTKVDVKTAQAILSNLATGLRPFLTLARTALRDDHNNIYREAVRAVAAGEATETIIVTINGGDLVASLVLLDPRSTLPQPLFSMSAKGMSGGEPDEQIPYALLN